MIRVLFVGDGPRDATMNPPLVRKLLRVDLLSEFRSWARLHGAGSGYERKLLFALGQARDADCQGLVATVDQDRSAGRQRLAALVEGRTRDRETRPAFPVALGCANPHAEAWLLDDAVAVRTALGLAADADVPNVRRVSSPKDALTALHSRSPRASEPETGILAEMASLLAIERCAHRTETGFEDFAREVATELGPIATSRGGHPR